LGTTFVTTVAIIGARGQLGTEIVDVFTDAPGYRVCPLSHEEIEAADPDSVRAVFGRLRPSVVINCAAFNRVDDCEDRPHEAWRVNTLGALHVAEACAGVGALCVFVSTDYVFGGLGRGPYTEGDEPAAVNVYGASKLAGERLVSQACSRSLIVRVAGLYGRAGSRAKQGNFVHRVLAQARSGQPVFVVDDVRVSPTSARDAARALDRLVRQDTRGIVHLTNSGSCTWYEFARRIMACAGLDAAVVPVPSSQYPAKAPRPRDSSLRSVRIAALIGSPVRPWEEALQAYLAERGSAARHAAATASLLQRR
jgi:dTDP-4-dehydrorhamnose reductase